MYLRLEVECIVWLGLDLTLLNGSGFGSGFLGFQKGVHGHPKKYIYQQCICCQLGVAHWLQPEAKCGQFLCVGALGGDSTGKTHGNSLINDLKQASHKAKGVLSVQKQCHANITCSIIIIIKS